MPSVITLSDAFGTSGLGGPGIVGNGNALGIPIYNAGTGLTGSWPPGTLAGPDPVSPLLKGLAVVAAVGALGTLAYFGAKDRVPPARKRPLRKSPRSRPGVTIYD